MEGDRWFELKRNGCPEFWWRRKASKYYTNKFMYTFPLYVKDTELVNGLIQNPGYENGRIKDESVMKKYLVLLCIVAVSLTSCGGGYEECPEITDGYVTTFILRRRRCSRLPIRSILKNCAMNTMKASQMNNPFLLIPNYMLMKKVLFYAVGAAIVHGGLFRR